MNRNEKPAHACALSWSAALWAGLWLSGRELTGAHHIRSAIFDQGEAICCRISLQVDLAGTAACPKQVNYLGDVVQDSHRTEDGATSWLSRMKYG